MVGVGLRAAVLTALVMSIFLNGTIGVTLAQANAMGAARLVWRVMFTRWGQELLLVGELKASTHHTYQLVIIKSIIGYYGFFDASDASNEHAHVAWEAYSASYERRCTLVMLLIALALRVLAFLCLWFSPQLNQACR